jgi:hypothetical protein
MEYQMSAAFCHNCVETYKLVRDKSSADNDFDEEVKKELLLHRQGAFGRRQFLFCRRNHKENSLGLEHAVEITRLKVNEKGYKTIPAENNMNHGTRFRYQQEWSVCVEGPYSKARGCKAPSDEVERARKWLRMDSKPWEMKAEQKKCNSMICW